MRLWHQKLIKKLPRQQLLGQHRECCALRGKGWGKKHSVVNYVFKYSYVKLIAYHVLIMEEMAERNYKPDPAWKNFSYRGKKCLPHNELNKKLAKIFLSYIKDTGRMIFPEHDSKYLAECVLNLKHKGIIIK